MALNFPNSPTNGQIYTDTLSGNRWSWDAANTAWISTSTFTQTITVSSTQPGSPVVGQLWWNQDYGRLLVYYNDGTSSQWVDASPSDATGQLAYNTANAVFNQSNTVYGVANAAFSKANTALQNTSGTFAGNLTLTGGLSSASPVEVTRYAGDSYLSLKRINGSASSPTTVSNGEQLGALHNYGYDGTNHVLTASMLSHVDSTVSTGVVPSRLTFFTTNSSGTFAERMRIDSSGRVTKPYQPFFYGSRVTGSGWATVNPTAVWKADTTHLSVGNNYNSSTGLYTCPVAGNYRVSATFLGGNSAGNYILFYLYKNGGQYGNAGHITPTNSTAVYASVSFHWIVACGANDTLGIYILAPGSSVYELGYNQLTFELMS